MASLIFVATAPLHPSDLKELLTYSFHQVGTAVKDVNYFATLLEMGKTLNSTRNKPSTTYFCIINHLS